MYCYHHPDRMAVGACIECNRMVCTECKVEIDGKIHCNPCIAGRLSGNTDHVPSEINCFFNTSGMGSNAAVPRELGDWNWGGFMLTWIWGIGNRVWWSFLVFVPWLGAMVIPWILAFKGNEWAWQSKHWDSIDQFKRVQRSWAVWGIACYVVSTLILLIVIIWGVVMGILWLQSNLGGLYGVQLM